MATKILRASWYDLPQYYDVAFRDETAREVRFLEGAFRRYAKGPVQKLLEPGCGTGRLVRALARKSYKLWAFDASQPALAYARRRLEKANLQAELFCADLTEFSLSNRVDAAFCTMNTFRHLITEQQARRHLLCVAQAVRPGGTYVLGLHLLPPDADETCIERWRARRGRLAVTYTLRVVASCRRRRREKLRISLLVRTPRRLLRIQDEFFMRTYSARQMRNLLRSCVVWELCDVFDFWYELDKPLSLDDTLSDVVLVLRRRSEP